MFEECSGIDFCEQDLGLREGHEDVTMVQVVTCPCIQHVVRRGGNQ